MGYKDKEKARGYAKEAMKRKRQGITEGITKQGITGQGITKEYPAIIQALVDPERRMKLEKIYLALKHRGLESKVDYGVSGISFDIVGEMLKVTEGIRLT